MKKAKVTNPVIPLDYPDPDVIRVGNTYYMVSTTMYFFPGCEILKSTDLINWEHASYVFETLDSTDSQKLKDGKNIYGQGMWAATFRYHKGTFYILFAANDTHKTYLFTSDAIEGPWQKQYVDGFYHDASLLFDDDGKTYLVHGNTDIYVTELNQDLSGPKSDGLNRCIVSEKNNTQLGYEGAHAYKHNGFYYVFLIHSLPDKWMRVQACFRSNDLNGKFVGEDILVDDLNLPGQGVAQGGIVDTPDGDWYAMLFQDSGAVGRLPVLVPLRWENHFPVIGLNKKIPDDWTLSAGVKDTGKCPLVGSDDFKEVYNTPYQLKPCWQFNHEPEPEGYSLNTEKGYYEIINTSISKQLIQAKNTLTQRMLYPFSSMEATLDGAEMKNYDVAGLCALQGAYGYIALTKEKDTYYLVVRARSPEGNHNKKDLLYHSEKEYSRIKVNSPIVTLKLKANFDGERDVCRFYYKEENGYKELGSEHTLIFNLDFFTGSRYGLFNYANYETKGTVKFSKVIYSVD